MGGDAVGVAGEHDQDLREHDEATIWLKAEQRHPALGVEQRQSEQDQRAGEPGIRASLRRVPGGAAASGA